jgi:hypothetical protein
MVAADVLGVFWGQAEPRESAIRSLPWSSRLAGIRDRAVTLCGCFLSPAQFSCPRQNQAGAASPLG